MRPKTSKRLRNEIQSIGKRMARFYASIRNMESQRSVLIAEYFEALKREEDG